jgi:hypothetical protein
MTLDLTAAFDAILHSLLLQVLMSIGICGIALRWFESYFNNRKIKVNVNNTFSEIWDLLIGIPQGGVLSPTLYSIYIADICKLLDKYAIQYHLYADDIIIYFTTNGLSIEDIQQKINDLMNDIQVYMTLKHLKLNSDKTEIMHLSHKPRLNLKLNRININDDCINLKMAIKSIGYIFDREMNMKEQITTTIKKCNYALHCIAKIRQYLDTHSTKIIINALVISKIEHNIELLYNIKQNYIEKLDKILRKCIRLIFKLKKRDSVSSFMNSLEWLPIVERIKLKNIKIIHQSVCNKSPEYIADLFQINKTQNIKTRQNNGVTLKVVKPISEFHRRAISVYGPTLYNNLPIKIRKSSNFNNNLKKYISETFFNDS